MTPHPVLPASASADSPVAASLPAATLPRLGRDHLLTVTR